MSQKVEKHLEKTVLPRADDTTELTCVEEDRKANLKFLESLDRVNRAMQGTDDIEKMMFDVLNEVLSIFDSDRVWLFYPCDPSAPTFQVPMEVSNPEYPGAGILNEDVPLPPDMAQNLQEALDSTDPITYVAGTERPINKVSADRFGVKSMILMALHPKSSKSWAFGMHQCSYPRVWGQDEKDLFQEIGRRLSDSLGSLSARQALQASEEKYRRLIETTNEGVWVLDAERKTTFINPHMLQLLGYSEEREMLGRKFDDFVAPEEIADHERKMEERRGGKSGSYDRRFIRGDGEVIWCHISATPLYDDKKQFSGSFGMITDISDRKYAEERLREQEKYSQSLLRLSRKSEQSQTYTEVLNAAQEEVRNMIGYRNVWAYLLTEDKKYAHALVAEGPMEDTIMSEEGTATLTIEGDPMLEAIAAANEIVIIEDAQTDERVDKKIVRELGNRTIVNVPIILFDKHLGSIGMGTFGDEGARAPSESEQKYLIALASHMAVAFDRIRLLIERKLSEEVLVKKNRSLRMLSNINQALIHSLDEASLLNEAARIVNELGGYRMLWIGFKGNDDEKTVRPVAYAGFDAGYLESAHITWADGEHGRGPVGVAIRTGETQLVRDISTEPFIAPWHKIALERGYQSLVALPLKSAAQTFGALSIYADKKDAFSTDELDVLEELADDLAFGIISLRINIKRKRAEKSLRESAQDLQKFKLALDNASDQVLITDPEGIVIYANPAVEKVTGYGVEDVVGKKSGALWKTPMPREYYQQLWHTIKEEKKVFVGEVQNRRKNGVLYTALISISPVLNKDREVIFFVGIERDITKEKEMDKAKSEFISLASHQMRTPLTAVNWYTEMLIDGDAGELNEKQASYFREIYTAAQKMNEIIKSFLHILRLEVGSVPVNPVSVNLIEMMRALVKEQEIDIKKRQLTITEHYQESLPLLSVDAELVRVILQNLVSNAVKYAFENGKIDVSLKVVEKGGIIAGEPVEADSVVASVYDTGISISVEDRDKLFNKFFRAENAKRQDPNGNGLGLYMAKFMADLIGGSIRLTSLEGEGATFFLVLPLVGGKVVQ